MTLQELEEALVDREAVQHRKDEVLAAGAAAAARGGGHLAGGSGDENEDNQAGAEPQPNLRHGAGVLGDATVRSRNAGPAPGVERRSRRDSKRRMDDEFEYEEPRTAKRAAAAGPSAARFGIRQPSQQAAAVMVNMASESQELYPVGQGGMRLAGLPGHLQKIEVVNFMCHEHFTMDFGEHVTFVSGTNGSGKSAVLQALQCCLGVKASNTGRANSFKKFIRTGADEAIVRVTVCNRPYKDFDAFRHSLFGDSITVERRISNIGTASSYTLKDHSGRIQGRKREDLDAMLLMLGLNAANPVCVMTQDTARNFLAGSSTKSDQEKYQLYMEATSLDQIAYNLEVSKGQVRLMDEGVQQIRDEFEKLRAEHSELQKSIAALQGIEEWRQEVLQLEQVLTWAVVDEHAAIVAKFQQALEADIPGRLAQVEQQVEQLQREHAALKQATDGKAQFLQTYNERASALNVELNELKGQFKEAAKHVKQSEARVRNLQASLADAQAQKETLECAVKEVKDEVVQATQATVGQYQRELELAREADVAARQQALNVDMAYIAASAATKAAHERAEAIRNQSYAVDGQLRSLQQQIQHIKEAGRSKLAAFGARSAVNLVQAIQKAKGQFSRPPIGPVGQHLALEDSRWAHAVEAALGFQLNSFLVHNMQDSQLLRRMIHRHFTGSKPSVYVVNFDLPQHNIPPGSQPPPGLPTIYRLLTCNDRKLAAPIMNNLVDQAHIEKLALGSDHGQCCSAAYHTPNVFACYASDGSKYYKRGSTQTSIPAPHWLRCARLGQSAAQQTTELDQEVQRVQQERQQLQQDLQQVQQELAAANAAEVQQRKRGAEAKRTQWEAHHNVTQLTQQPPPELTAATQADGDDALQADIWQATQACMDLDHQLRERQTEVELAKQEAKQLFDEYQDRRVTCSRLNEENDQFLATYNPEVEHLVQVAARLDEAQQASDTLLAKQAGWQRLAQQKQQELQQLEEDAQKLCSRKEAAAARQHAEARLHSKRDMTDEQVASLLMPELLHKKVRQLEKKIGEHEKAAGGSLEVLQLAFEASKTRMGRDGMRFREAIATFGVVDDALKLRSRKLSELDHKLEDLVNAKFRHYMWKKGHTGVIKLDRKARSLQLKVQIGSKGGGNKDSGAVKDLKQLSGGERSYTTVAFTLALGGQTEMPFRAMDEFDVFMDAINRRVAMQNLFSFAKGNPELQFIFLTPQDISAVEDARQACQQQGPGHEIPDGFVKIVTMRPPRANATRVQQPATAAA